MSFGGEETLPGRWRLTWVQRCAQVDVRAVGLGDNAALTPGEGAVALGPWVHSEEPAPHSLHAAAPQPRIHTLAPLSTHPLTGINNSIPLKQRFVLRPVIVQAESIRKTKSRAVIWDVTSLLLLCRDVCDTECWGNAQSMFMFVCVICVRTYSKISTHNIKSVKCVFINTSVQLCNGTDFKKMM